MLISTVLLGLGSFSIAQAINPLTIKGSKFFNSDGSQFYIKGISYQLTPEDPLIDGTQCQLDAKLMQTLGANTIRVYHVDASENHDACMQAFADVGIYTFIDLDTFSTQIEQDGPPHWNSTQLYKFTAVLDAFAGYPNSAGFFIGNEVITNSNGSWAAPYIKAAIRDVKAHIKSKSYSRPIYVGYSAADIAALRPNLQNYLACGDDSSMNIDFYGLNAYEWCGVSDYKTSGYSQLNVNATGYSVPIFFSETGCNTPAPRTFDDQGAIFGSDMSQVWSGAIIYEWIEEVNNYGLIKYPGTPAATAAGGDKIVRSGTPVPVVPDFSNLQKAWAAATPTGVSSNQYTPSSTSNSCPAMTPGQWNVDPSSALPTLGQEASLQTGTNTAGGSGTAAAATATNTSADHKNSASQVTLSFGLLFGFMSVVLIL